MFVSAGLMAVLCLWNAFFLSTNQDNQLIKQQTFGGTEFVDGVK